MRSEIKHFEDNRIDVDKLLQQNRESDRIRSQMVILERRVQVFSIRNKNFLIFLK